MTRSVALGADAADPDRRIRALDRLRLRDGVAQLVARPSKWCAAAVHSDLMTGSASSSRSARSRGVPNWIPSIVCSFSRPGRADAELQPSAGEVVDRDGHLRQHRGMPVGVARDGAADPRAVVFAAIAASIVQASKIGPSSGPPRVAKWSIFQKWSKPASSAICQIVVRVSIVAFWLSLSPNRSGCICLSYPKTSRYRDLWRCGTTW